MHPSIFPERLSTCWTAKCSWHTNSCGLTLGRNVSKHTLIHFNSKLKLYSARREIESFVIFFLLFIFGVYRPKGVSASRIQSRLKTKGVAWSHWGKTIKELRRASDGSQCFCKAISVDHASIQGKAVFLKIYWRTQTHSHSNRCEVTCHCISLVISHVKYQTSYLLAISTQWFLMRMMMTY